jgi:CHAT domain-containing protein/Tfp pilus assembly protein PilF
LGNYNQSYACYQQLLKLSIYLGDRQSEASTLNAIARIQSGLGEYQSALDNLNLALAIWYEVKYKTGQLITLNEIALIYFNLGEFEKAIDFYNRSLQFANHAGNLSNLAGIYHNLGQVYLELGDLNKALEIDQQGLKQWDELLLQLKDRVTPDIKRGKAASLNNIGFIQTKLQNLSAALENYRQALNLWQNIGDLNGEASTLNNLGDIYLLQNKTDLALKYYQHALTIRHTIKDPLKETISLYSLAVVNRQLGNLQIARQYIENALDIIEKLRIQVKNQDLRTSLLASKQDYYRFYIDLLMELDKKQPKHGWDVKALIASERSKARSLLDILAQSSGKITNGISPDLLNQKEALEYQLQALESQRNQLFDSPADEKRKNEIESSIVKLSADYRDILNKISIRSTHYQALNQPTPLNLTQIQKLLDKNTILLEYSLGDKRSYLWSVTYDSISSYELPSEAVLEKSVKEFREAFLFPAKRIRRSLAIRSSYFLKKQILPEKLALSNKRIVIVADGILQYIPFAALSNSEQWNSDSTYLIDQHELVSVPSASVLGILRQETNHRKIAPKVLAVFADPVFSTNDERLKFLGLQEPPLLASDLIKSARESGVVFNRLPFTQTEAQKILSLIPHQKNLQQIGFLANRSNVLNSQLDQYRLIHFASHGLLNSQNPQLSGLVLSLFDSKGNSVNGFLRLLDIFNLHLSSELVVLSACQTGLGKVVKGEGILGLTRGFMYAGSPRVVVSLWSVDDQATSLLMTKFYEGILEQKLTPAAALRRAERIIKATKEFDSPYYWAPFILQGEWR